MLKKCLQFRYLLTFRNDTRDVQVQKVEPVFFTNLRNLIYKKYLARQIQRAPVKPAQPAAELKYRLPSQFCAKLQNYPNNINSAQKLPFFGARALSALQVFQLNELNTHVRKLN